jgi:hypothetical protein
VVGATLMNPDRVQPGLGAAVAYVPYQGPSELALNAKVDKPADQKPAPAEAAPQAATPAAPPRPADDVHRRQRMDARQQEVEEAEQGALPHKAASRLFEERASGKFKALRDAVVATPATVAPVRRKLAAGADRPGGGADLVWRPAIETDARGHAELRIPLPAVGAYRVRVEGYAPGRLGAAEQVFQAQLPCQLECKTPAELTVGDQGELPLVISNPTGTAAVVEVNLKHGPQLRLKDAGPRKLELKAGESRREPFHLEAAAPGECVLTFRAQAGRHSQLLERSLAVTPRGYPSVRLYGGRVRGDQSFTVELPAWQADSLAVTVETLPTLLAELERAYAAVEQAPEVCAEQPAAAAWLAAMALEQVQRSDAVWPEVVRRWRARLTAALGRLAPYEATPRGSGGYAWFVAHPAHEAVSALVLAAFDDIDRVTGQPLGREPLNAWLRARFDTNGALRSDPKSPSIGLTPEWLGACLSWALARHHAKGLDTVLKQTGMSARKTENLWQVALTAGALLAAGAKNDAAPLVDRLASAQREDGRVPGTPTVQTTAMAASVWLQAGRKAPAAKALDWLCTARQADGGFGPPHATALVLRAMSELAHGRPAEVLSGKLSLRVGGTLLAEQPVGTEQRPLVIADPERRFRPGKNLLSLSLAAVGTIDTTVRFRLATDKPEAATGPLALTTRLESPRTQRGQTVGLTLEVANTTDWAVLLPLVELGLPAGLEPRVAQLQQLKKQDTIDQFTTDGRRLTLAWQSLAGRKRLALRVELDAVAAGRFQGPASTACPYHRPEAKSFAAPLSVEIVP